MGEQPHEEPVERAERALLEDEALIKRLRELDAALKRKKDEQERD